MNDFLVGWPYFLNPAFLAAYPFSPKQLRIKAAIRGLVPGIPLDDKMNPDDDTVAAAIAYIHIADHFIWRGADYISANREWLENYPPQIEAIEWACSRRGLEPRACDLSDWIPVGINHDTFWNNEKLLYASKKPKIRLEDFTHACWEWTGGMPDVICTEHDKMIKVLRKALKIDFHPDCKERVTHAIELMIDDLS